MRINSEFSTIFISTEIQTILTEIFKELKNRKIFVLVDENTKSNCLPLIYAIDEIKKSEIIEIKSGESNKTINTVEKVWKTLQEKGADRTSLLINLGGGIIGDLGGFAASTFKRGIDFINIPTTLLSQVDASIGGKTGVNFYGLKNEIGVFNHPKYILIDSSFNQTLDDRNILSGWAEMLKHALIFDEKDWLNLINHKIKQTGFKELNQLIARSVNIKNHFVEQDPFEKNIRKALNFGHTFGHAFESFFMSSENEILHGEAIAHGIICEIYLSHKMSNFPIHKMDKIVSYIFNTYKRLELREKDFEKILELIGHDKKSEGLNINLTLLEDIGQIKINQNCKKEDIIETLKWYSNLQYEN
ncbi:MAG TPA: 3-dehydroquinate synthase [Bacteroidales bacterium]|nr:3-dehydroquinate synthase [Bacteroidales bacterium]